MFLQALVDAERRIQQLEQMVEEKKQELRSETEASSIALEALEEKERALAKSEEYGQRLGRELEKLKVGRWWGGN